jgi:voltage-dependent potassium channel beta subunit
MFNASMQYRYMGKSGLRLSALGLGGWTTYGASVKAEDTVRGIIRAAYEAGINFFDISDIYEKGEAEKSMGAVFRELPRHELVISTKCFWPMSDDVNDTGLSRKHIFESVHKSLKRIGTDYVDIYFCHRPDPNTPADETVAAMTDLIRQGKILYWGTSEHSAPQMQSAHAAARDSLGYAPRVEQPQLSLVARHRFHTEVQPAATELGMGLVTWSPLASGLLSGKYDDGLPEGARLWRSENLRKSYLTDANKKRVKEFKAVADELGVTRAQLAIAWCAAQTGVTSVITGATRLEQLQANLGALKVKITAEINKKLDAVFPPDLGKAAG